MEQNKRLNAENKKLLRELNELREEKDNETKHQNFRLHSIACDIRIAADDAKLGSPEIDLGVYPGWGGTQRLPRIVGMSKAREIMYTGDRYTARQALEMGLVDRVVPADRLMDEALALAEKIASKAPMAIRYIKTSIYEGMQCDLQRALQMESALFAHLYATKDTKEAYAAYLEKRPPKGFIGR